MSQIYNNCIVTLEDSKVKTEYAQYKHDCIDLWADKIYSPFYGIVIAVDNLDSNKLHRVIIQYSGYLFLSFYNLIEVYVKLGDKIIKNQLIALADSYVSLELLSTLDPDPIQNHTSVFVRPLRLFRYDPNLILSGSVTITDPKEDK